MYRGLLISVIALTTGTVNAQTDTALALGENEPQVCSGIFELAGRDYSFSAREYVKADYAYNHICSGKSVKEGLDFSSSAALVLDGLPTKIAGNFSGRKDKAKHMCETQEDWSREYTRTQDYSSTVVREALDTYIQCLNLVSKSVIINVTPGDELFVFKLRRGNENVTFEGLDYAGGNMNCSAPSRTQRIFSAKTRNVTSQTQFKLNDGRDWHITCKRNPRVSEDGISYLEKVEVAIKTDRGSLLIKIPRDQKFSPALASEFRRELSALKDYIDRLENEMETLGTNPNNIVHRYKVNGPRIGGADSYSCPPGTFISMVHASGSVGGRYAVDGISEISFACTPVYSK